MSFAVVTHLAEGLCLSALITLKVENYLICLVDMNTNSVHDGMAVYFALENNDKK
jgi:hypothetical protein